MGIWRCIYKQSMFVRYQSKIPHANFEVIRLKRRKYQISSYNTNPVTIKNNQARKTDIKITDGQRLIHRNHHWEKTTSIVPFLVALTESENPIDEKNEIWINHLRNLMYAVNITSVAVSKPLIFPHSLLHYERERYHFTESLISWKEKGWELSDDLFISALFGIYFCHWDAGILFFPIENKKSMRYCFCHIKMKEKKKQRKKAESLKKIFLWDSMPFLFSSGSFISLTVSPLSLQYPSS